MASPMLSTSGLPTKIMITGLHIAFEVEYLWNDRVKKDRVNANLI